MPLKTIGIRLETIHSPFKNINRMWYDDPSGEGPLNMMLECLSFCADHKVPIMVIHESASRVGPDMSNDGLARFRKIFEKGNELATQSRFCQGSRLQRPAHHGNRSLLRSV